MLLYCDIKKFWGKERAKGRCERRTLEICIQKLFSCAQLCYIIISDEKANLFSKQKVCALSLIRQRWLLKLRQDIAGVIGGGIARLFSISRRHCLQKIKTWCMYVISKLTGAKAFLPLFKQKERKSTVKWAGFCQLLSDDKLYTFHTRNELSRESPTFFLLLAFSLA